MTTLAIILAATALAKPGSTPELDVRIDDTHYTVRHLYPGGYALAPKDYRLLVVRYRVRNGADYPLQYNRQAISFSILTEDDRITAGFAPIRMAAHGRDELRPGETREDETWLEVPCDAVDPKLAVRSGSEEKTFPLTSARPDPSPWREAPSSLEVKTGQAVPLGPWDVAVNRVSQVADSPTHLLMLNGDDRAVLADVEFRNAISEKSFLTPQSLIGELIDADGKTLPARGVFFDPKTHDRVDQPLNAKGKAILPVAFDVPATFQPTKLRLMEPSTGRAIVVSM